MMERWMMMRMRCLQAVYETWRRGTQLWLMTYGGGPSGGYIIVYESRPYAVYRWRRTSAGQDPVVTPLPDDVRLLYTDFPLYMPVAHVREYFVVDVESMDMEALDVMYAAEFYDNIWEDAPWESPRESPATAPSNNVPSTVTVTEERRFNSNCPICHEDHNWARNYPLSVRPRHMHQLL